MNCVDINSPHRDTAPVDQGNSVTGVTCADGVDAGSGVEVTCGNGQGQAENADCRDPVTGLSALDRQAIRCSWTLVSKDLQTNGTNFMIRFFTEYPANQASFTDFRDVSLADLRHQDGLQQHAMRVMKALTAIVDSIDDSEVLISVLHRTVDSHLIRGIRVSQFTELLDVFARFLVDSLGPQFTDDMCRAWQIAVSAILCVVQARVEEHKPPSPTQHTS